MDLVIKTYCGRRRVCFDFHWVVSTKQIDKNENIYAITVFFCCKIFLSNIWHEVRYIRIWRWNLRAFIQYSPDFREYRETPRTIFQIIRMKVFSVQQQIRTRKFGTCVAVTDYFFSGQRSTRYFRHETDSGSIHFIYAKMVCLSASGRLIDSKPTGTITHGLKSRGPNT